ncbi:hypothetical protein Tco_0808653 [Tanacetum coccineum]
MSPPIRRKYRASVAFATGCRRINKSRRCNRKIRVPIAMWPFLNVARFSVVSGEFRLHLWSDPLFHDDAETDSHGDSENSYAPRGTNEDANDCNISYFQVAFDSMRGAFSIVITVDYHSLEPRTFMNGKPHTFNGTEGVVGLRRWIEKVEQVFETCKCAEEDKVMFAASTFEGHDVRLRKYCPATEIQRMEQELWTLTLKGDDIEAIQQSFP